MVWLDTNVIIRLFTGVPREMAEASAKLIDRALAGEFRIALSPVMIAEAIHVLGKQYGIPLAEIAHRLDGLVADLATGDEAGRLRSALSLFITERIDFVDAWIAVNARARDDVVASFDRDFRKLRGVAVFDPLRD